METDHRPSMVSSTLTAILKVISPFFVLSEVWIVRRFSLPGRQTGRCKEVCQNPPEGR